MRNIILGIIAIVLFIVVLLKRHRNKNKLEMEDLISLAIESHEQSADAVKKLEASLRRLELVEKYGLDENIDAIMNREYWIGQTKDMLFDSLGHPANEESHVTKTKSIEILKFDPDDNGKFMLQVRLENGIVAGWDKF